MSTSDAQRWDKRYQKDERYATYHAPRSFLVNNAAYLPKSGFALDIATGLGGNAGYLVERGFQVVGVDVSSVAIQRAKMRWPELRAVLADLNYFYFPENRFDLILNFYYLQRDLWSLFKRAIRPGGVLVFETLTVEMLISNPDIELSYLLRPGELREAFSEWNILVYEEGWKAGRSDKHRAVASLIAQKPGIKNRSLPL
jgi:tellurite methyltransferase